MTEQISEALEGQKPSAKRARVTSRHAEAVRHHTCWEARLFFEMYDGSAW